MRRILFGAVFLLATFAFTTSYSQDEHFTQAANKDAGYALGESHWIGSILQSNNSRYSEGMSTLQRLIIKDLPSKAGNVHTVKFSVQATKDNNHAYDFLTNWLQAAAYATSINFTQTIVDCGPNPGSDPQGYLTACQNAHANSANATFATFSGTVTDPVASTGGVDAKRQAYNAAFPQGSGPVQIWGTNPVTAASISFDGYSGTSGNELAKYTVTFTAATGTDVVLEFAGHLAVGKTGYGPGLGAGGIDGGPYHFKLDFIDEKAGSQDNQIMSNDIIVPPSCDLDGPTFACLSTTSLAYSANADVENGAVTYLWSFVTNTAGAKFGGAEANPTTANVTVVPVGSTFTPGGSFTLKVVVTREGISHTCYLNSETSPGDLVQISDLAVNPTATPTSINLAFSTTSQLASGRTGGEAPFTYLWTKVSGPSGSSLDANNITNPILTVGQVGTYVYNVQVTDNKNCVVNKNVTIEAFLNGAGPCTVANLDPTCENTAGLLFTAVWSNPAGYNTSWSIQSGNGVFAAVQPASILQHAVDVGAGPTTVVVRFSWSSPTGLDAGYCEGQVVVNAKPTATTASQRRCSSTSTATFDLSALEATVLNGQTGASVTWFNNIDLAPAHAILGALISAYVSGAGTVYAVVTKDGCTAFVAVQLYIDPNPSLVITNPEAVCQGLSVDLTAAAVTAGSNLQGGQLSYWTNAGATTSLDNPGAVTVPGTYYIKVLTGAGCYDIQPVVVSTKTCGSNFYSLTQGKYGNIGGKACTPDGQLGTVDLIKYEIDKFSDDILTIGSNNRFFKVRLDASIGVPSLAPDADILGLIAALPGGGKSAVLPENTTIYAGQIPATMLKNGKLVGQLLAQTIALGLNQQIAGNLSGFELKANRVLYSTKRKDNSACTSTDPATCLDMPNPYNVVGILNSTVVGYLIQEELTGFPTNNQATVAELYYFANQALGGAPLPTYNGVKITLDMISSVEDAINNVFDQGAIFVDYAPEGQQAPICPVLPVTSRSIQPETFVNNSPTTLTLSAYPNPARGQASFRISSPVSGNAVIQLFAADGTKIQELNSFISKGAPVTLPVTIRSKGTLTYRVTVNGKVLTGKLINL